MLFIRFI